MSAPLLFATSNNVKFNSAEHICGRLGIVLEQTHIDLQEIQSDDGKDICLHKAAQAYEALQKPVIVSDDTWIIPGLNGFPGPYMKYINDWLNADDLLRLTSPLTDRRIILRQHVAYHDGTRQEYFVGDIAGILLPEIRGHNKYSNLTITSLDGGKQSIAEALLDNKAAISAETATVWHKFGDWLQTSYT